MPSIVSAIHNYVKQHKVKRLEEGLAKIIAEIPIPVTYSYFGLDQTVQFTATKSQSDSTLIDVVYSRELIEDYIDTNNYTGFAEMLCRDFRSKTLRYKQKTKRKKQNIPSSSEGAVNCDGCGAPVQSNQIRCAYCRRPYPRDTNHEVLKHYSIRDGIKVCDSEIVVTTTGDYRFDTRKVQK